MGGLGSRWETPSNSTRPSKRHSTQVKERCFRRWKWWTCQWKCRGAQGEKSGPPWWSGIDNDAVWNFGVVRTLPQDAHTNFLKPSSERRLPRLPCLGSMLWWNPSLTIRRHRNCEKVLGFSWVLLGSLGFSWCLLVSDGYGPVKSVDSGRHGVCHCLALHHQIWRMCPVVTVGNSHSLIKPLTPESMVQNPKITSICWLKTGQQVKQHVQIQRYTKYMYGLGPQHAFNSISFNNP